jgi:hypothetical protein
VKDLRFLDAKETFLERAYLALKNQFSSRDAFVTYFNAIKDDEQKNLFLRTATFYLFLVKCGDWVVDVPDSDKVIDYFTNTYKYVAIFSLIESLSEEQFIDFYQFLTRRKSEVEFPIPDWPTLDKHYDRYKQKFGSIRRCISFFRALSPERQGELLSRFEVKGSEPTIENLAKYLYEMRSKFVHEAALVLHMSDGISIGMQGGKIVICNLSIKDAMLFFEEGLIEHFRCSKT